MITSDAPPLPQYTPGTKFVEDVPARLTPDLIGRVLAGLMAGWGLWMLKPIALITN